MLVRRAGCGKGPICFISRVPVETTMILDARVSTFSSVSWLLPGSTRMGRFRCTLLITMGHLARSECVSNQLLQTRWAKKLRFRVDRSEVSLKRQLHSSSRHAITTSTPRHAVTLGHDFMDGSITQGPVPCHQDWVRMSFQVTSRETHPTQWTPTKMSARGETQVGRLVHPERGKRARG